MSIASNSKEGDDFWNTSSSFGFNFDDDDAEQTVDSTHDILSYLSQERSALPIHSIISKYGLERILAHTSISVSNLCLPDAAVKAIFLGQDVPLERYRSLSEKTLLLDTAIQIRDGNVISKVLIFLKSTLEQSIFHQILTVRKPAVFQYAYEVMFSDDTSTLSNLFLVTGLFHSTPEVYMVCSSNPLQLLTEFNKSKSVSKGNFNPIQHKLLILQWQSINNIKANTTVELLVVFANSLIEKKAFSMEAMYDFKNFFDLDEMTFEWTLMNVLASKEMWQQLSAFAMKPNWFNKKNILKLALPADKFVYGISRHHPPNNNLDQFLEAIPDGDTAVNLAIKLKCHKFVIHYFTSQKDKASLLNYRNCINPNSAHFCNLERALQSLEKKWKN